MIELLLNTVKLTHITSLRTIEPRLCTARHQSIAPYGYRRAATWIDCGPTVRVSRRERAAHNSAKMPTILRTKRSAARSVGRHVAVVSVFRARAQPTFLSVSVRAPRDTAHHGAVRSAFRYRFRATQIPPQ